MFFSILDRWGNYPSDAKSKIFLTWDDWNDFQYYTSFGIFYVNEKSEKIDLGGIKIGILGQLENQRILRTGITFEKIGNEYFSVGIDVDYYENLNKLGTDIRDKVLIGLNDIAQNSSTYNRVISENVTQVSFLRFLSSNTITGQFRRLALGGVKLTKYDFTFISQKDDKVNPVELSFNVEPNSNPPTNIHTLIGRNGVGKTHIINNIINTLIEKDNKEYNLSTFKTADSEINNLFPNLVCVTFSAFDDFEHPVENKYKSTGIRYAYIGLKSEQISKTDNPIQSPTLGEEFIKSLIICKKNKRIVKWKEIINTLESDPIFKSIDISSLIDKVSEFSSNEDEVKIFKRLSSGHKIVLLTVTKLVEKVQEKSLVLFDEPESHLHPPLLASFIRAVSNLLIDRNAVGIIATHSPVILQEVPRSCVWKLRRNGSEAVAERLQIESFGENVGVLTQEIFGLEVTDSGFHQILKELVEKCSTYEEAIRILNNQIGLEAKSILRSLFFQKNNQNEIDI